jgi:hypothetical protein
MAADDATRYFFRLAGEDMRTVRLADRPPWVLWAARLLPGRCARRSAPPSEFRLAA